MSNPINTFLFSVGRLGPMVNNIYSRHDENAAAVVPPVNFFLLQEDGSYLLQEDGSKIIIT